MVLTNSERKKPHKIVSAKQHYRAYIIISMTEKIYLHRQCINFR